MKTSAAKYLAIICILLIGKNINSQAQNSAGLDSYKNGITESGLEDRVEILKEEPTEATEPSDIVDVTTLGSENGDSEAVRYCKCDCNTGIIFTDMSTANRQHDQVNEATATYEEDTTQNIENEGSAGGSILMPLEANAEQATAATINDAGKEVTLPITEAAIIEEHPSNAATAFNVPALTVCTIAGSFPSESNCRAYFTCSPTINGDLERTDAPCPAKTAFNIEFGRCTRDITACTDDGITCTTAGTFEDPISNTSYYWCVPRRILSGFRKYHVECEAGKVFVPLLGKCFIDINNLQNLPPKYGQNDDDQPDDEDIVEAELKQFKAEEKLKMKEEKLKLKLEKKLQKELAKKAAKEAKEQAKIKSDEKSGV